MLVPMVEKGLELGALLLGRHRDEVSVDVLGNVIGVRKGSEGGRFMVEGILNVERLTAHAQQTRRTPVS